MINHAYAIVAAVVAVAIGNAFAIVGGMYLDYRFQVIQKVEPYITKAVSLLKRAEADVKKI